MSPNSQQLEVTPALFWSEINWVTDEGENAKLHCQSEALSTCLNMATGSTALPSESFQPHGCSHHAWPCLDSTQVLSAYSLSPATEMYLEQAHPIFIFSHMYFKESPQGGRIVTCWDWWSPDICIIVLTHFRAQCFRNNTSHVHKDDASLGLTLAWRKTIHLATIIL